MIQPPLDLAMLAVAPLGEGRNRSRNFGPDAKPQRGGNAKAKKKESERPRGPIPLKNTGRSFTLDDADTAVDDSEAIDDDFATSRPSDDTDDDK